MPDDLTGSRFFDLVLWLGSVVTAVGVVAGALWWLVLPRVRSWFAELVREVAGVRHQLSDDSEDTVGRHARVAANAAKELPELRREVNALAARISEGDRWRETTDRRLGSVEGALLALLGPELRRRLFTDLTGQEHTEAVPHHRREET